MDSIITEQDERDLKRSWGADWKKHAPGKIEAVRKANALLAKMKGKGWEISVFENLGWHYRVMCFPFSVRENEGRYSVLMSDDPEYPTSGAVFWTKPEFYDDPNVAVSVQLATAEKFTTHLNSIIKMAKQIYEEKSILRGIVKGGPLKWVFQISRVFLIWPKISKPSR